MDLRLLILDYHDPVQGPYLPDAQPPPRDEVAITQVVEHRSILVPDLGDSDPLIRNGLTQSKGFLHPEVLEEEGLDQDGAAEPAVRPLLDRAQ